MAALALSLSAALAPGAQARLFGHGVTYPTSSLPEQIAAGDFNGDGIPDVAVTEGFASGQVQVLLGQPGGKLGPAITVGPASYSQGLAIADLYGTGKPAILTTEASGSPGDVLIFAGDGHGGFAAPQRLSLPSGSQPRSVAVGDVNGDGHPDIVVAEPNHSAVYLLLGQPGGTFAAPVAISAGSGPWGVALAKLTGSGHLDLIVTGHNSGTVSVLRGNGDGSFQAPQSASVGNYPTMLAVSDLNRDGIPDVVVANAGGNSDHAVPLLSTGTGGLVPQAPVQNGASIAVSDFTGDGIPDLVTSDANVYPGTGSGSFGPALQSAFVDSGLGSLAAPVVADFNHDGKPDVVMAHDVYGEPTGVAVFLNVSGVTSRPTLAPATRTACDVVRTRVASIPLNGAGFFPGDAYTLSVTGTAKPGVQALGGGQVAADGSLHPTARIFNGWLAGLRPNHLTLSVTDSQDNTIQATTSELVAVDSGNSTLVGPYAFLGHLKSTFQIIGFRPGATVYEHYVFKGRNRKTVRLGRATGPCGAFKKTIKRWAVTRPFGTWRLQIDTQRRYSSRASDRHVWSYILRGRLP